MSVIVLGMEMPKNCNECRFAVDGWCYAYPMQANGDALNKRVRTNWCPLRPLPEKHGRIVDVGPLEVVAYNQKDHEGESFDDGVAFMLEKMDALPTIVEAKGE